METLLAGKPGVLLIAGFLILVLFGFSAFMQSGKLRNSEGERMVSSSNQDGGFALRGKSSFDGVSAARLEIDNGEIDCKVAVDGKAKVSWSVEERRGVDAEDMEVLVEVDGDTLVVEDEWHGGRTSRRPAVNVTLWLPADAALELALGNGDV